MDKLVPYYAVLLYQIYFVRQLQGVFYSCNTTALKEICCGQVGSHQVIFSYQLTKESTDITLKLSCEAKGYPQIVAVKDTNTTLAERIINTKNYHPGIVLTAKQMHALCLLIKSYICEVTYFEGNYRTYTLHVTHPKCPPRLLDVTKNNSVVLANVNDTAVFTFSVISPGNVTVDTDTNSTQVNITECQIDNCLLVRLSLTIEQESDFKNYTGIIKKAEGTLKAIGIMYSIELKDFPQFCYNTSSYCTIYTQPSANLSVNFCLKSGIDIQHQHKMEVYVDNQRLSDKDIQVKKYNKRYQYGLDIVLYNHTYNTNVSIKIRVFNVSLESKLYIAPTSKKGKSYFATTENRKLYSEQPNTTMYTSVPLSPKNLSTFEVDFNAKVIIGAVAAITIFIIIIVFSVKKLKVNRFQEFLASLLSKKDIAKNNSYNSSQLLETATDATKNEPSTSRNIEGLIYVTVDHTSLSDSLSTNRSNHSQDHVVYARLDFQKMARQHTGTLRVIETE